MLKTTPSGPGCRTTGTRGQQGQVSGQEPQPSPQGRGTGRPCSLPGAGGGGASLGSPQLLSTMRRDGFSGPSLHLGTREAMLEAPGPLLASLHPARELGAQVPQVAADCPLHPFPPGLVVLEPAQTDESVTRGPQGKPKEPHGNAASESTPLRVGSPGRVQWTGPEGSTGKAGSHVGNEEAPLGVRNGVF